MAFFSVCTEFMLKNLPPTPNTVLENARKMAMQAGIKFVYTGNNPGQRATIPTAPAAAKSSSALVSRSCAAT